MSEKVAGTSAFERLLAVLNSPSGPILVTVLIGGLFSQLLANTIQNGNQKRDQLASLLKTRSEQGIAMHRRYAEDGLAVLDRAFTRIGEVEAATENLVLISADSAWAPERYEGADQARIREQRNSIRQKFNEEAALWSRERYTLGLQLDYYFGSDDDSVNSAWTGFDAAFDAYIRCAYRHYVRSDVGTDFGCVRAKARVRAQLSRLATTLRARRVYLWQGWDVGAEAALETRRRSAHEHQHARLVKVVTDRTLAGGPNEASWDGTREDGSAVTAGVYFVELAFGEHRATQRIAWVR